MTTTFNDGLYTPFTPTASIILITLPAVVETIQPTTDSPTPSIQIDTPTPTPTPSPVVTPSPVNSNPQSTSVPTPSITPVANSDSALSTPPTLLTLDSATTTLLPIKSTSSSPQSISLNSLHLSSVSTGSSSSSTSTSSAASATDLISGIPTSEFKISYLTPIFIIVPGLLLFTLLGYCYKKRKRSQNGYNDDDNDGGSGRGSGRWFPGNFNNKRSFEGDRAILSPEEEGGLVQSSRWKGEFNEKDENGNLMGGGNNNQNNYNNQRNSNTRNEYYEEDGNRRASRWSYLLPDVILRHFRSSSNDPFNNNNNQFNNNNDSNSNQATSSFISIPYAALDVPFEPPRSGHQRSKSYLTPSADEHERKQMEERGWNWGTKPPASNSNRMSQDQNNNGNNGNNRNGSNSRKSGNLAEGWKWASKKYKAKRENSTSSSFGGSERSRISPTTRDLLRSGHLSPSLYSPSVENGDFEGGEAVLDLILAESRVGHGDTAQEFLSSDALRTTFPVNQHQHHQGQHQQQQQFRNGPITTTSNFIADYNSPSKPVRPVLSIDLPTTPSQLRLSPTKPTTSNSANNSNYLPGGLSSTTPSSNQLLFSYNSPPVQAFTSNSAQRDTRRNSTLSGPNNNSGPLIHTSPTNRNYNNNNDNVGNPMPLYQPPGMTSSDSNYSLNGVRGLVFGDEEELLKEDDSTIIRSVERRNNEIGSPNGSSGGSNKIARAIEVSTTSQLRGPRLPPPSDYYSPTTTTSNLPSTSPRKGSVDLLISSPTSSSNHSNLKGFNPIFSETQPLKKLNHPSRVQSAIEEINNSSQLHEQLKSPTHQNLSNTRPISPTKKLFLPISIPPSPKYLSKALPNSPTPSIVAPLFSTTPHSSATKTLPLSNNSNSNQTTSPKIVDSTRIGTLLLQRSKTGTYLGTNPSPSMSPSAQFDLFNPTTTTNNTNTTTTPTKSQSQSRSDENVSPIDQPTFSSSSFTRRPSNFSSHSNSTSNQSPTNKPARPLTVLEYSSIPIPPMPSSNSMDNVMPLSADPKRLSAMLRKNTGKQLRVVNPDENDLL